MSVVYLPPGSREALRPVIGGWEETMLQTCLQGEGATFADRTIAPRSAQLIVADFCFFAGLPCRALVENSASLPENFILVADGTQWHPLIEECFAGRVKKITRYRFAKTAAGFRPALLAQAPLPEGFVLRPLDTAGYAAAMAEGWSRDLCGNFAGAEDYARRGLGFGVFLDRRLVSGASSYTVYDKGLEIQIDTHRDFRRRGLAYAAAAALILECLRRGWYPSWDAHNAVSRALAEKLGYRCSGAYTAYAAL